MEPIALLFIDRNAVFLRLATSVLRHYHQDEVKVIAAVGGYEEMLALGLDVHPHVVLLGLGSSGLSDLAIIPRLRRILPQVGVIVLGLIDADGYDALARAAGADAFVLKASMSTDLLPIIRCVAQSHQRVR
jgi:DNA-binding NarL/FixJ family response regulator